MNQPWGKKQHYEWLTLMRRDNLTGLAKKRYDHLATWNVDPKWGACASGWCFCNKAYAAMVDGNPDPLGNFLRNEFPV